VAKVRKRTAAKTSRAASAKRAKKSGASRTTKTGATTPKKAGETTSTKSGAKRAKSASRTKGSKKPPASKPAGKSAIKHASQSVGKPAGKPRGNKAKAPASASKGKAEAVRLMPAPSPADDPSLDNLAKIDHVVVLMMENRSFDHLLGYLSLEAGKPVDGLTPGMSNQYNGRTYPIHRLTNTAFERGQDPCHTAECIAEQLQNHNGGFVANFARTFPFDPNPGLVMGYYNAAAVPVYDHLANSFCACDRWFSSVDGATWPNRLYSVTGRAANSKNNRPVPLYNIPSFVRHLDRLRVSWNWYAHDISTLRLIDGWYSVGHFPRFRYFEHPLQNNFLCDAAMGRLPAVSWIDPNFNDIGFSGNDDHPPADIADGQALALKLVHAVTHSPQWSKTLLVIVYDEHGGLYDHVEPPAAPDDKPAFRRYGVRVPALVVSPWVERGSVSSMVFDHTTLIKTILLRFCRDRLGNIPDMGTRVRHANHLGSLLTRTSLAQPVPFDGVIDALGELKKEQLRRRITASYTAAPRAVRPDPGDFQAGLTRARAKLTALGLPEGQL